PSRETPIDTVIASGAPAGAGGTLGQSGAGGTVGQGANSNPNAGTGGGTLSQIGTGANAIGGLLSLFQGTQQGGVNGGLQSAGGAANSAAQIAKLFGLEGSESLGALGGGLGLAGLIYKLTQGGDLQPSQLLGALQSAGALAGSAGTAAGAAGLSETAAG